jgi:hypothetical protein
MQKQRQPSTPQTRVDLMGAVATEEASKLFANRIEIERRAKDLEASHQKLRLEVQTRGVSSGGIGLNEPDLASLRDFVERRIAADKKIFEGFSNPAHQYWEYKCSTYGAGCFNKRLLVPNRISGLFPDAFSGCFCTKYKTHMIEGFNQPNDLSTLLSQSKRIGHPFELVFIMEGQEGIVKEMRDRDLLKDTRIVVMMNPFVKEPPTEGRKESIRRINGVNAIDINDLGALFLPPVKFEKRTGLRESLTGQDMWLDLVCAGKIVRIDYKDKIYQPPYKLIAVE